jgi:flagellar assembly protein FliH
VLRDVRVEDRPYVLVRPGSAGRAGGASPAGGSPIAKEPAVNPYDEGYRAGRRAGEAAVTAKYEATLESGYRSAFEQGLAEGRQQGLTEGREAGRQAVERDSRAGREEMSGRLAQLEKLLAALPAEMERRLASAEDEMVALCHGVVCRLLGDALVTREGVAQRVRQALHEAGGHAGHGRGGARQVAVHLHPRDLAALEQDAALAAWMRQEGSAQGGVRWVADERVGPGGCMVCSAEGNLDARLETQMAALRQLLLRQDPGGDEPVDSETTLGLMAPPSAASAGEAQA